MGNGGYSHGMMNLFVPPEIAQPIHSHAKELHVRARSLMLEQLSVLADKSFIEFLLEDEDVRLRLQIAERAA